MPTLAGASIWAPRDFPQVTYVVTCGKPRLPHFWLEVKLKLGYYYGVRIMTDPPGKLKYWPKKSQKKVQSSSCVLRKWRDDCWRWRDKAEKRFVKKVWSQVFRRERLKIMNCKRIRNFFGCWELFHRWSTNWNSTLLIPYNFPAPTFLFTQGFRNKSSLLEKNPFALSYIERLLIAC
jgi:hypothetical protein